MSTLIEITSEEDFNKHCATLPPTTLQIIYFKAEWAAPCAQMTTVLSTLAASYPSTTPPSTTWLSMDAEEVIELSDAFDVTAVPYLILRRGTTVLETVSGSDATKVRSAIEKYTSSAGITSSAPPTQPSSEPSAKNLSTYTPSASDPATAPAYSSSTLNSTNSKEELHTRLTNLVKAAPVMLFMKGTPSAPQCGFSRQLVATLRENSVKYGFFNILADDDVRQGLKEFADWPTFPQLWVEGELVGGLDIVKEEILNDPDFLKPFSVPKAASGPAAPSQQATTTV